MDSAEAEALQYLRNRERRSIGTCLITDNEAIITLATGQQKLCSSGKVGVERGLQQGQQRCGVDREVRGGGFVDGHVIGCATNDVGFCTDLLVKKILAGGVNVDLRKAHQCGCRNSDGSSVTQRKATENDKEVDGFHLSGHSIQGIPEAVPRMVPVIMTSGPPWKTPPPVTVIVTFSVAMPVARFRDCLVSSWQFKWRIVWVPSVVVIPKSSNCRRTAEVNASVSLPATRTWLLVDCVLLPTLTRPSL